MTDRHSRPDPALLARFDVADPVFVTETPIATIWKVRRPDGTPAALKIYADNDLRDEAPGFDLLEAQNGRGTARLYARAGAAILIEWLDGPSLGDLVRQGREDAASRALVDTANRMHGMAADPIPGLDPLDRRFQALFTARCAPDCPPGAVAALRRATDLATQLIATQTDLRPLHGDFHHDNIRNSPRGYLAFDAKGVFGDRHFELANAFGNPLDMPDLVRRPDTITRRAEIWAAGFRTEARTLLDWAAAYAALSLSWTHGGVFGAGVVPQIRYLEALFGVRDAT